MGTLPTVYVICGNNCKYEGMTKEQILTAITQAVNEGTIGDIDTGFITTVKTINGNPLKFFVGEQTEYDALTAEQKNGVFAIITNDTTKEGIYAAINKISTKAQDIENWINAIESGTNAVPKALNADNANRASRITDFDIDLAGIMEIQELSINQTYEKTYTRDEFRSAFKNGVYLANIFISASGTNHSYVGAIEIITQPSFYSYVNCGGHYIFTMSVASSSDTVKVSIKLTPCEGVSYESWYSVLINLKCLIEY